MTRPAMYGFQKPLSNPHREVGLAVISYAEAASQQFAECSCGWSSHHPRSKVLEDRIDEHLNRRHDGRGLRL